MPTATAVPTTSPPRTNRSLRSLTAAVAIAALLPGCAAFEPLKRFGLSVLDDFSGWLPRWAVLYEQGDISQLLALYFYDIAWVGPDVKTPIRGTEALRVHLQRQQAAITDRKASCSPGFVTRPAENQAIVTGQCQLSGMPAGQPRAARVGGNYLVTMALVRTAGEWRIASQHLSALP